MSLRAATRQSASPAANLLRNSRLFSLPPPLPKPSSSVNTGMGVVKQSDSATLPYPSQQALTTTYSGLSRGDWGLKRNLPLKSTTNTSNPAIRFRALDTIEHVTDFESAQDHVRTLEKWEEMDVPMLMDLKRNVTSQPGSAFERDLDITAEGDEATSDDRTRFFNALKEKIKSAGSGTTSEASAQPTKYQPLQFHSANRRSGGSRWKFDGPWIPTMAASEFTKYLEDKVSKRRDEFNAYVVEYVKHKIYTDRRSLQLAKGFDGETEEEIKANEEQLEHEMTRFTKDDIQSGIHSLRTECLKNPIHSELVQKLVIPFLGLPPIERKDTSYSARGTSTKQLQTSARTTHPSAGLGYLRSNAYLTNHPILGPQAGHTPVEARVIQPRKLAGARTSGSAKLGVGGIVADTPMALGPTGRTNLTEYFDLGPEGGQKIWVEPVSGSVGRDGRIVLELGYPDTTAVAVRKGEIVEKSPGSDLAHGTDIRSLRRGFNKKEFADNMTIPDSLKEALGIVGEGENAVVRPGAKETTWSYYYD